MTRGTAMRSQPNIIFMLTDDQGTLDANCYGAKHLHTPTIDGLAETGIRFTRAYSHTVCCPARANLLTGRHSQRVGINHWTQANAHDEKKGINIHADQATIASIFKEQGYATGLFGKWHLGAAEGNRPLDMGFDVFYGFLGGFIENYTQYSLHMQGFHDFWDGTEEIDGKGQYYPRLVNDRALSFIDRNRDNPFFLYLPYNLPHYPEQSEDKYAGEYENVDERVKKYGMTVSTVDGLMGEIVDKINELGLRDDTIILFMSDNGHSCENYRIRPNHTSGLPEGWFYGAHGAGYTGPYQGTKGTFTEGGIRVPCVLSAPGRVPEGVVSDNIVCGLDWLPTVLGMCGIDYEPVRAFDGLDLSKGVVAGEWVDEERFLHLQWHHGWMTMKGDWKLIGNNNSDSRQLVKVTDNNPETINYLKEWFSKPEHQELAESFEAEHARWLEDVRCGYEDRSGAKDRE